MISKILAQTLLVSYFIALIRSETVWFDVETGKLIGVSDHKNSAIHTDGLPFLEEENSSADDVWNCRNRATGIDSLSISNQIMVNAFPELIEQAQRLRLRSGRRYKRNLKLYGELDVPQGDIPKNKWVCSNSKNGNWVIISNDDLPESFEPTTKPSIVTENPFPTINWGDLKFTYELPTTTIEPESKDGGDFIDPRSLPLKLQQNPK